MSLPDEPRRLKDPPDERRLNDAMNASQEVAAARAWVTGKRPEALMDLVAAVSSAYVEVENSSPPSGQLGGLRIEDLRASHPLVALSPQTAMVLRQLMFQTTQLYRSVGVLVGSAGYPMMASLLVLGRSVLEAVGQLNWLTEPLDGRTSSANEGRVAAARALLVSSAGVADLVRDAENFQMDDLDDLRTDLAQRRTQAAAAFGPDQVKMDGTNPRRWSVDGERLPSRSSLVEQAGERIFSGRVRPSGHYHGPSMATHVSLGSSLGRHLYVDHGSRSHHVMVLDVEGVEGWLWYYTVWYRFAVQRCAQVQRWDLAGLDGHDAEARAMFGRSISPVAAD